jgi:hypothetical protein
MVLMPSPKVQILNDMLFKAKKIPTKHLAGIKE